MRPLLLAALLSACTSAPSEPSPTLDAAPDAGPCASAGQSCGCVSGAGIVPGTLRCVGDGIVCDCAAPDAGTDAELDGEDDGPGDAAEVGDDAPMEVAVDALDVPSLDASDAQVADADAACETTCDGACVDTGFDPFHCGACGVRCMAPAPNTRAQCFGGRCVTPCLDGYRDCNETLADGCETLVNGADRANCGSCRFACNPIDVCVTGRCRLP